MIAQLIESAGLLGYLAVACAGILMLREFVRWFMKHADPFTHEASPFSNTAYRWLRILLVATVGILILTTTDRLEVNERMLATAIMLPFLVGLFFVFWGGLTLSMIWGAIFFGHSAPYRSFDEEVGDRAKRGFLRLCIGAVVVVPFLALMFRMNE